MIAVTITMTRVVSICVRSNNSDVCGRLGLVVHLQRPRASNSVSKAVAADNGDVMWRDGELHVSNKRWSA